MSIKLIMESWRKFLVEEEGQPGQQPARGAAAAAQAFVAGHGAGLEDFVSMLKKVANDPEFRKLAMAGRKDSNGPADEALTVSEGTPVAAKDLTPTQKDIDMEKSLGDQMINKWTPPATEAALSSGTIMMPSPGGAIPVLTFGNKYILDGHHRWSQVMMTNPDGKMAVNNLSGDALPNAEVALKATQLAIAGLGGRVVTKGTKVNLLSLSAGSMGDYVRANVTPEVLELLVKYGKISKPDKEEAARYYMGNLAAIQAKPAGKFDREAGMPQADDSGVPQAQVNTALKRGMVNFDNPSLSDTHGRKKAAEE
jgi:hypothetical protein